MGKVVHAACFFINFGALNMTSQLNNTSTDRKLSEAIGSSKAIKREALAMKTQADANGLTVWLRDAAATRKNYITAIDLGTPNRMAMALAGFGVAVLATAAAWSITHGDEVVGMPLYGLLAATAAGAIALTAGVRRLRDVQCLDKALPAVVNASHVEDAGLVVKTLGEYGFAPGSALITIAAGVEGVLAGFVIGSALANQAPMVIQLGGAVALATALTAYTAKLGEAFRRQVASIRARIRMRALERIDFQRYPQKKAEADFFSELTKTVTGDDHSKPGLRDYVIAAGTLLAAITPFAVLATIRLDSTSGIGSSVTIGMAVLATAFAVAGCAAEAAGALMPDRQRIATLIRNRFASIDAFNSFVSADHRGIERWANQIARKVRNLMDDADLRTDAGTIVILEPFPHLAGLPASAVSSPTATPAAHESPQKPVSGIAFPSAGTTGWAKSNSWRIS